MSSSSILSANKALKHVDLEERKALLTPGNDEPDDHSLDDIEDKPGWSRRKIALTAMMLIMLLITGIFARMVLFGFPGRRRQAASSSILRSNGTHEFKPTVLMVSIDGLRADYLDRGLTPHLLDLSKKGLRAKSMKPIFPTLTFPNHWSLMTGLHAESHGIIANNFWDPILQEEFHYNRLSSVWNPAWWFGEPIWETAEKAGVVTANLMWPGPPKTSSGASSTYFIPWKDKVPLENKLNQILKWVDLPLNERPQLIMAYEPSLDQAGHATGPYSSLVNETLREVDKFTENLHDSLAARNLTEIVDIIFVSDHGMTDTSHPELVYIDDILGADGFEEIAHQDGWPSMGLRFHDNANVSKHLEGLLRASNQHPEKFEVYTHETMPQRYHFTRNERIAPIYIVPKIGHVLTTRKEGNVGTSKGEHGYDNDEVSMQAIFVAHGPFSINTKAHHQRGLHSFHTPPRSLDGWHSTSDGTFVMSPFPNVEIYNLVIKLLGVSSYAAKNNGTVGFWDQYL